MEPEPETQGDALVFIHIFWKADGGIKPPGCDFGDMARVGEHTRPRVSSSAPSPKTFGCDRERKTKKVSGGGAGNSTRGRVHSPPLARHIGMTALASRVVCKDQSDAWAGRIRTVGAEESQRESLTQKVLICPAARVT